MNTLISGDMTQVLKEMSENSVDAVITDPPYGMDIVGEIWDKAVPPTEMWQEAYRVLKPGGHILAFASPKFYHRLAVNIEDAGFEIRDMFQWVMSYKMPRGNNVRSCHEPIFVGQKPIEGSLEENHNKYNIGKLDLDGNRIPWYKEPPKSWPDHNFSLTTFGKKKTSRDDPDYKGSATAPRGANEKGRVACNIIGETSVAHADKFFYTPRVSRKEKGEYCDHATVKPIALMEHLVSLFAPEGSTVLDPFMGSGTTGIACNRLNRNFIGIDLDPHYVELTKRRIEDHSQTT
jgi:DNA modification methylase